MKYIKTNILINNKRVYAVVRNGFDGQIEKKHFDEENREETLEEKNREKTLDKLLPGGVGFMK